MNTKTQIIKTEDNVTYVNFRPIPKDCPSCGFELRNGATKEEDGINSVRVCLNCFTLVDIHGIIKPTKDRSRPHDKV